MVGVVRVCRAAVGTPVLVNNLPVSTSVLSGARGWSGVGTAVGTLRIAGRAHFAAQLKLDGLALVKALSIDAYHVLASNAPVITFSVAVRISSSRHAAAIQDPSALWVAGNAAGSSFITVVAIWARRHALDPFRHNITPTIFFYHWQFKRPT
jgi:hypothetical protein